MPSAFSPPRLLPLCFFLGGLLFALALVAFHQDEARPVTPIERADRLAAENYRALSFTAPLPPSPDHWGQQFTAPSARHEDRRHAVPREASALMIALTGGHAVAAGVLAFALSAAALAWAAAARSRHPWVTALLASAALFAIAKSRSWHLADPFPFLTLTGGALVLGGWLRRSPGKEAAWSTWGAVAGGLSLLLLCAPPLALAALVALGIDFARTRRSASPQPALSLRQLAPALAIILLTLGFLGLRNLGTTGALFTSPASDYASRFTTAPVWFWQQTRAPFPIVDPVIERYDELVAIPAAAWSNPVILQWFGRITEGAHYAGGIVLALIALATALLPAASAVRAATALVVSVVVIAMLRFEFPLSWWPLLCPALVLLAQEGAQAAAALRGMRSLRGGFAAGVALHVLTLPAAPAWRPPEVQYKFRRHLEEIAGRIHETAPKHLLFARLEPDANGLIEPADLPRNWQSLDLLIARDLGEARNAELIAAMPERQAWRILILDERIGLQRLTGTETETPIETSPVLPTEPAPAVPPQTPTPPTI